MNSIKLLKAFLLIVFPSIILHSQNVQERMDGLERKDSFYEYYDKHHKKLYAYGWIEQIYPYPIFRNVSIDKKSKIIEVSGITTADGNAKDTASLGFCCFEVLVAQSNKKGYLKNVRLYGTTHSNDSGDTTQKDGYFHIKFKANPDDIFIIGNPGRNGRGSKAYFIGRLLKEE